MSLKVVKHKLFNGQHYLSITNDENEQPVLITKQMHCEKPETTNDSVTVIISKADDPMLYKSVCDMEEEVAKLLENLPNDFMRQLPANIQDALKSTSNPADLIRPNYLYTIKNEPTMYLKGTISALSIINGNGKKQLKYTDLTGGNYRFKIRASLIYCGHHKNHMHLFNLQLRIIEIAFNVPRLVKQKAKTADELTSLFGTTKEESNF